MEEIERRHLSERNFLMELLNSDMGKYNSGIKTLSVVGQQARLIQLKVSFFVSGNHNQIKDLFLFQGYLYV